MFTIGTVVTAFACPIICTTIAGVIIGLTSN